MSFNTGKIILPFEDLAVKPSMKSKTPSESGSLVADLSYLNLITI